MSTELTGKSVPPSSALPSVDWYGKAETAVLDVVTSVRAQRPFTLGDLPDIAGGIAASVAEGDQLLIRAISHHGGASLVGNMVHVTIYAVKLGVGLGYRRDELARLALAALVHDVGMAAMPQQLLEEGGKWSDEQRAQLQQHPMMGAQLLKQAAPDRPWLAEVVSQEHERINGSGYPMGLQGQTIHEFALVIGLADILDAMMRARTYRKGLLPHEAVRLMLSRDRALFPNRLFKCLLEQFSLFPVGTWVKLTSGEVGEVIRPNRRFPLRPAIRVTIDQGGFRLLEPKEIDLSTSPLIHVGEIVERVEMSA
jgi:hypothetical protein